MIGRMVILVEVKQTWFDHVTFASFYLVKK